ncbi:hypothetical protein DPEC_G00360370 [Dallia pectoralis]|uniref:Uncharacterized protein n=1 Tax=Dallia pectoralis TaxID=75939 RepID=A0ACC2F0X8_DALPE|nr:hypothetical protein DPEC_G00360370 [Dallia pectoralis]
MRLTLSIGGSCGMEIEALLGIICCRWTPSLPRKKHPVHHGTGIPNLDEDNPMLHQQMENGQAQPEREHQLLLSCYPWCPSKDAETGPPLPETWQQLVQHTLIVLPKAECQDVSPRQADGAGPPE